MKAAKKYRLYVPESIDLKKIAEEYPVFEGFNEDIAYYILYTINKPFLTIRDFSGYTSISSKTMEKAGIRNFRAYRKYLMDSGVIYTDGKYSSHFKEARKFRFTDKYTESKSKTFIVDTNAFSKHITKMTEVKHIDKINNSNLWKSFQSKQLSIELEAALRSIELRYQKNIVSWNKLTEEQKKSKYRKMKNPIRVHDQSLFAIYCIHERHYRFMQDTKSGRVHHILTNIHKSLRQFLRYEGMELVNLDFKNSQPFLSSILFNENFWRDNLEGGFKMLGKDKLVQFSSCQCYLTKENDIDTYVRQVQEGTFYESLMKLWNMKDRAEAKIEALVVMFSKNTYKSKNKRLFEKAYPNVSKMFECIRGIDDSDDSHKKFPILLQQLESSLFIGKICKRINTEYPEMRLFTIHDSVLTTKNNAEYIERVMREETIKLLGVEPTISKEY